MYSLSERSFNILMKSLIVWDANVPTRSLPPLTSLIILTVDFLNARSSSISLRAYSWWVSWFLLHFPDLYCIYTIFAAFPWCLLYLLHFPDFCCIFLISGSFSWFVHVFWLFTVSRSWKIHTYTSRQNCNYKVKKCYVFSRLVWPFRLLLLFLRLYVDGFKVWTNGYHWLHPAGCLG